MEALARAAALQRDYHCPTSGDVTTTVTDSGARHPGPRLTLRPAAPVPAPPGRGRLDGQPDFKPAALKLRLLRLRTHLD
jgi:hypothetical protein